MRRELSACFVACLAFCACAEEAAFDDASALVQAGVRAHGSDSFGPGLEQEQQEYLAPMSGSALLAEGDWGVETDGAGDTQPPVELAASSASTDIPALGGKGSLTEKITNLKLWRVNDGLMRTFRSVNGSGYHMYGTKPWRTSRKAQATLFKAHGDKVGVISMNAMDAFIRLPREALVKDARQTREKLMPVTYFVSSFQPVCMSQKSSGKEPGTGAPIYTFAKITKFAVDDRWTVRRLVCDAIDASNTPHYKLAYTMAHHGSSTGMDALHPIAGIVGTIDADKDATAEGQDWSYNRRVNAWLTKGEDPALFTAVVMITQMPVSPVVP